MNIIPHYVTLARAYFEHLGADAANTLQHYIALAQPLLDSYGYLAVLVAVFIEGFGIPAPGQTLLMAAVFLAARGEMSLTLVLALALLACVLGNTLGYGLGRRGVRRLLLKARISDARMKKMERLFSRYGGGVVLIGRFFDGLRQLNGIAAGSLQMPFWKFTVFNILGAIAWTAFWGLGVYWLEKGIKTVFTFFHTIGPYVTGASLLAVIMLLTCLHHGRKHPESA
jgi:membrane protein DedA with SNARE-associated domain